VKLRTSAVIAGTTALVGAGALLYPAVASTHVTTHTLRFTSVTEKQVSLSKTTGAEQDKALNSKGKLIGFDEIYSTFNPKAQTGKGTVVLDIKGGFVYGVLDFGAGSTTTGKVTGGTGKFKGVTGTIVGTDLNKSGSRTAVVIKYH
jgi:hypothetical protein